MQLNIVFPTLLILAYPWAGSAGQACSLCSPFSSGRIAGRDPTCRWGVSPGPQEFTPSDCAGHLANQSMELTNSKGVGGEGEHSVPTLLSDYIVYIS